MTKKGSTIALQFKIGDINRKQYGCNCAFTLDGMVNALSKAHKVAEKLKEDIGLAEFWEWYDKEIKDIGKVENNLLTFKEAIAVSK